MPPMQAKDVNHLYSDFIFRVLRNGGEQAPLMLTLIEG